MINCLLVRWRDGWREVRDDTAIAATRRCEGLLGIGAISDVATVDSVAAEQLAVFGDVREQIELDPKPSGGDVPLLDFNPGDTITVPASNMAPTVERVHTITMVIDNATGQPTFAVELKDALLDDRERWEQALKKMTDGTVGGQSKVAQPVSQLPVRPPLVAPPVDPFQPEIVFSLSGALTPSTSPPWVRHVDGVLAEVYAILATPGTTATTVDVVKNGTTVHTCTIAAGASTHFASGLAVPFDAHADVLTDVVTSPGAGAGDLTVSHRFRY